MKYSISLPFYWIHFSYCSLGDFPMILQADITYRILNRLFYVYYDVNMRTLKILCTIHWNFSDISMWQFQMYRMNFYLMKMIFEIFNSFFGIKSLSRKDQLFVCSICHFVNVDNFMRGWYALRSIESVVSRP